MDKFELKNNLKKTKKIIEYAIEQKIGKSYTVKIEMDDADYDNDGLISVMYLCNIEFYDPVSHLEIDEITYELEKQTKSIESVLENKNSSIGRNGLFGPYDPRLNILGPSIHSITYNTDIFAVKWLFEIALN